MRSCLYECRVMHQRFAPKAHRFDYRIFYFAIDLDELGKLHRRFPLFSVNRANLYAFREDDFLPTGEPLHNGGARPAPATGRTLKERVAGFLRERGVDLTGGRVVLVTLPRVLGYRFNPVSFYFCFGADGAPLAALAEVTNTFREMKTYFLGPGLQEGAFRLRIPKYFYVSPYSDVDVAFDFRLVPPGERLVAQIDDYTGEARTLASAVIGERRALTGARLAWWTVKYPLITLRIIALIHWQALRLRLKGIPWFAKAARGADQRDLHRPHASIAPVRPPESA